MDGAKVMGPTDLSFSHYNAHCNHCNYHCSDCKGTSIIMNLGETGSSQLWNCWVNIFVSDLLFFLIVQKSQLYTFLLY